MCGCRLLLLWIRLLRVALLGRIALRWVSGVLLVRIGILRWITLLLWVWLLRVGLLGRVLLCARIRLRRVLLLSRGVRPWGVLLLRGIFVDRWLFWLGGRLRGCLCVSIRWPGLLLCRRIDRLGRRRPLGSALVRPPRCVSVGLRRPALVLVGRWWPLICWAPLVRLVRSVRRPVLRLGRRLFVHRRNLRRIRPVSGSGGILGGRLVSPPELGGEMLR